MKLDSRSPFCGKERIVNTCKSSFAKAQYPSPFAQPQQAERLRFAEPQQAYQLCSSSLLARSASVASCVCFCPCRYGPWACMAGVLAGRRRLVRVSGFALRPTMLSALMPVWTHAASLGVGLRTC